MVFCYVCGFLGRLGLAGFCRVFLGGLVSLLALVGCVGFVFVFWFVSFWPLGRWRLLVVLCGFVCAWLVGFFVFLGRLLEF